MVKKISWQVVISDEGQMGIMEKGEGIKDSLEDHLMIVGILDQLKDMHSSKLRTRFDKTKEL